ncbi:hypothetical protein SO802_025540 [Lithocarpus litseifolius]|uniref:Uncharacterized protein n=1 Tax=Lithocarpus litseifolius TaxID=425828 RepID=A0AAW2C2K9_9ROSI
MPTSGPTGSQSVPRKDGGYHRRGSDKWTAKPSRDVAVSNSGPSHNYMGNDKSLDNSLAQGSGNSPSPSGQGLKKLESSVKGKKAIARGSLAKAKPNSADNPLSNIFAAKITPFSSDHVSSPSCEKCGSSNSVFEFTAPSSVGQELHDDEDNIHLADGSEGTLGKPLAASFESKSLTNHEIGEESVELLPTPIPERGLWTLLLLLAMALTVIFHISI